MAIGISVFELHLPHARSLKDKRKVIKSLIERMHRRYRVSVAETDLHDLHQRSEISLAVVARSDSEVENRFEELRRLLDSEPAAVVTLWSPTLVEAAELSGDDDPSWLQD